MAVVTELIRTEENGTISFGNYELDHKAKADNFEFGGDIYKVKTFKEITKLEKNGMFVYESVPGTSVNNMKASEHGISFSVEGKEDAQITVGVEDDKEYKVYIDDSNIGKMKTKLGGKLVISVELANRGAVDVKIVRL